MLKGHGNGNPFGIFIADGGSKSDLTNQGKLLSGNSERVLKEILISAGQNARDYYFTALIKEVIITHRSDKDTLAENAKKQTKVYEDLLKQEIDTLNPFLLIPIGELAFRYLTGFNSIRKFRGSVLQTSVDLKLLRKYKVLPILGPQPYLNLDPMLRIVTEIDAKKIGKLLNTNPPPELSYNIWICKTASALSTFLNKHYNAEGILYFDIETFGGMPTCISFCFGSTNASSGESICIPFLDLTIDRIERAAMLRMVLQVLNSPIKKVNQNIAYDWKRNEVVGMQVKNVAGDTMLALSCIYPEFPKNLGFQNSIYTDIPYFKDEGKQTNPNQSDTERKQRFYLYNAKDALAVSLIYPEQLKELDYFETRTVYENLVKLIPIFKKAESTGIRIDNERRLSLQAKYESLYEIERMKLNRMVGHEVNPHSTHANGDMNRLIFEELGYKKIPGVKGTDEKSIKVLMAYGTSKNTYRLAVDILQSVLDCRKLHKVLEFVQSPIFPDKRFRGATNLAGTENGRTSGGETSDSYLFFNEKKKGSIDEIYLGHSLQTIGKHGFDLDGVTYGRDLRDMFVADPDYTFVNVDGKSAEARVDAVLAGNYDILQIFDGPIGIHRLTGSWIYNCDPKEIKKDILVNGEERYHISKIVRHAAERNLKEYMLMTLVRLPVGRCREILDIIHARQPEIRAVFHADVINTVQSERRLVCPNGRHRIFMGRMDKDLHNEAISFLPQAIVGDQLKFALLEPVALPDWVHLVQEAHDSLLFLCPKGRELEFAEKIKPAVERPIDFRHGSLKRDYNLVIPAEFEKGEIWSSLEEIKV